MRIAIDAMGGDHAPGAVLDGVGAALPSLDAEAQVLLFGDEAALREGLAARGIDDPRVRVIPTTEVISCEEQPTLAVRRKKDSSMVRAVTAVAQGEADCVLSAGSTGALLTGATLIIKRLPGAKRPALATVLPAKEGCAMLLDCGANTDCKPQYLVQFAVMGSAYMQRVMGVEAPRVGLLNNGAEEEKGNELTKAAYQLLKEAPVRFAGNCEARDAFSGEFDVVVCDGFDGNVLLKATEGTASLMTGLLKTYLKQSLRTKLGAALSMPALKALKRKLDYTEYGGAPLLGVRGGVVKAHGSSNGKAFASAIRQAARLTETGVVAVMAETLAALPQED